MNQAQLVEHLVPREATLLSTGAAVAAAGGCCACCGEADAFAPRVEAEALRDGADFVGGCDERSSIGVFIFYITIQAFIICSNIAVLFDSSEYCRVCYPEG